MMPILFTGARIPFLAYRISCDLPYGEYLLTINANSYRP